MKRNIIISPYSRPLRNGGNNPKNYPFWEELIFKLKGYDLNVLQIGAWKEQPLLGVDNVIFGASLNTLLINLREALTFICVDNFLPHFAHFYNIPGIVLWGQSDPTIFGYPENDNLLLSRKHLRPKQFDIWEGIEYKEQVFVKPDVVISVLNNKYIVCNK